MSSTESCRIFLKGTIMSYCVTPVTVTFILTAVIVLMALAWTDKPCGTDLAIKRFQHSNLLPVLSVKLRGFPWHSRPLQHHIKSNGGH